MKVLKQTNAEIPLQGMHRANNLLSSVVRTEKIGLLPSDSAKMIHQVLKDFEVIFFFTLGKVEQSHITTTQLQNTEKH